MEEFLIRKIDQFNSGIDQYLLTTEENLIKTKESQIFQKVILTGKDNEPSVAEHADGHWDSHNDHSDTSGK